MKALVAVALLAGCGRVGFGELAGRDGDPGALVDGPTHRAVPTFVQAIGATDTNAVSGVSGTLGGDIVVGNTLVVAVDFNNTSANLVDLTDSLGNSFTRVFGPSDLVSRTYLYAAPITTGGHDSVKATIDAPSNLFDLRIHEFTGLAPLAANSTSVASGTVSGAGVIETGAEITTTEPNDLIFVLALSGIVHAMSPYAMVLDFEADISEILVATTPGIYVPVVVVDSGAMWVISAVVLHAAEI